MARLIAGSRRKPCRAEWRGLEPAQGGDEQGGDGGAEDEEGVAGAEGDGAADGAGGDEGGEDGLPGGLEEGVVATGEDREQEDVPGLHGAGGEEEDRNEGGGGRDLGGGEDRGAGEAIDDDAGEEAEEEAGAKRPRRKGESVSSSMRTGRATCSIQRPAERMRTVAQAMRRSRKAKG